MHTCTVAARNHCSCTTEKWREVGNKVSSDVTVCRPVDHGRSFSSLAESLRQSGKRETTMRSKLSGISSTLNYARALELRHCTVNRKKKHNHINLSLNTRQWPTSASGDSDHIDIDNRGCHPYVSTTTTFGLQTARRHPIPSISQHNLLEAPVARKSNDSKETSLQRQDKIHHNKCTPKCITLWERTCAGYSTPLSIMLFDRHF